MHSYLRRSEDIIQQMKTFLTVLLLGSALFACDDSIPLQRRKGVDLGVVGKEAPILALLGTTALLGTSGIMQIAAWDDAAIPYEVPAHYECSKPGYGVVWEHQEHGYSITCISKQ